MTYSVRPSAKRPRCKYARAPSVRRARASLLRSSRPRPAHITLQHAYYPCAAPRILSPAHTTAYAYIVLQRIPPRQILSRGSSEHAVPKYVMPRAPAMLRAVYIVARAPPGPRVLPPAHTTARGAPRNTYLPVSAAGAPSILCPCVHRATRPARDVISRPMIYAVPGIAQ